MNQKNGRIGVWVCNIIVAVLCVLSMVCYFIGPFWRISVNYKLEANVFDSIIGDVISEYEIDLHDVLGDGVTISVPLEIASSDLINSFSSDAGKLVTNLVDHNVKHILKQLTGTLNRIARSAVTAIAKGVVKSQVRENISSFLGGGLSSEEVVNKLSNAGVDDNYLSQKTEDIINAFYKAGGTNVDEVTDTILETIDEVYAKLVDSSDSDFDDLYMPDDQRESIRGSVQEVIGNLAEADGTISPDDLIAELLLGIIGENGGNTGEAGLSATARLVANDDAVSSAQDRLTETVSDYITDMIPEVALQYIIYVFYVMFGIMAFSMLAWFYVLIKIIVKAATMNSEKTRKNPTVKLGVPIWLGWLPFLLFVGLPSIGMLVARTFLMTMLGDFASVLGSLSITFSSAGWMAAASALVAFAISIYFMVMRKKFKKEPNVPYEEQYDSSDEDIDVA